MTTPAEPHPHGSVVEQVHRIWTTDQGVDPWVLAEETVKFVTSRAALDNPPAPVLGLFDAASEEVAAVIEPMLSGGPIFEPDRDKALRIADALLSRPR